MREIPLLGTTHADHFKGSIPVTRSLTASETASAYELNTGKIIVERFRGAEPAEIPARLVAHHGPFTWGSDPLDAVKNAIAPERVAELALLTLRLQPEPSMPAHLVEQHFGRKHGPGTTYGKG